MWPSLIRFPGYDVVDKFGESAEISKDETEPIWDMGGAYTFTTTAQEFHISSSEDTDTQEIEVQGLDENFAAQTVTQALAGNTETVIGNSSVLWMRVFRAKNIGSVDLAGDCYIYEDDDVTAGVPQTQTKIRAKVSAGQNQTLMAIYTIPAGKQGWLRAWSASIHPVATPGSREADIRLYVRPFGQVFHVKRTRGVSNPGSSLFDADISIPSPGISPISEKSDIKMEAHVIGKAGHVSGGFQLEMINMISP